MRLLSPLVLAVLVGCSTIETSDTDVDTTATDSQDADADGFSIADGDCNDANAAINPDAAEQCDGLDNNCSGTVDDGVGPLWYADADNDGYGDPAAAPVQACNAPAGHVSDNTDCDDSDRAFNPGALESDCTDPADYNCDGSVGFDDADNDGFAACEDCDDTNAAINPDATEVCNGQDDDCDGSTDDDDNSLDGSSASTFYEDDDNDGYGDPSDAIQACDEPDGYVTNADDCNDTNAAFNPGAEELDCTDPADYNCDGSVGFADEDNDGFAACEDCDDNNPAISPLATEVCNGQDDNCNGATDDEDDGLDIRTATDWFIDSDEDGFGQPDQSIRACLAPDNRVADNTDCDDLRPDINPAAIEVCDDNNTDENCNALADDQDGSVQASGRTTWYADADLDGFGEARYTWTSCDVPDGFTASAGDCDDSNASINPDGREVCDADNADEDCNGSADDLDAGVDASTFSSWFTDNDRDGYGSSETLGASCDAPSNGVDNGDDCNDGNPAISPDGTERCNGVDDDCDGVSDGTDAIDVSTWYPDNDQDGFAGPDGAVQACDAPDGYLADALDCDDLNGSVSPVAPEVCNGRDDDCDRVADDNPVDPVTWYRDSDNDGYGDSSQSVSACEAPDGYVADDGDCDDNDPNLGDTGGADSGSVSFTFTNAMQTFEVPDCVDEILIEVWGAEGVSGGGTSSAAGRGGYASGTLSVSRNETLYVMVGGQNGFNGGGSSWSGSSVIANGGGASDVRVDGTGLSDRVIVAGGGGGTAGESTWGNGGHGGGGACGANYCGGQGGSGYSNDTAVSGSTNGGGGTSGCHGGPSGGAGLNSGGGGSVSSCYGGASGGDGQFGVGGNGASSPSGCCQQYGVAGGGGGYYGGGGVGAGCCGGGGAGGGSSWTGDLQDPSFDSGIRSGNGQVTLSW